MWLLRAMVALVLGISSLTFAQTPETPDASRDGSPETVLKPCQSPGAVEVLTDTKGVNFGPYLSEVIKTVRENWHSVMPPSVYPPVLKKGRVSIEFVIMKNGKVSGMALRDTSFDTALDRAALASITASSPFVPLPEAFTGQTLGLRFFFYYNMDASRISLSPCMDVRVAAGATQQFSAVGKKETDTTVMWSVSGPGCEKSACGTISEQGLYTAPVELPKPATVFVEAALRGDASVPCKVKVTIVAASPAP